MMVIVLVSFCVNEFGFLIMDFGFDAAFFDGRSHFLTPLIA